METYITRQPIMDKNQKVVAYELLYQQDSSSLYNQRDTRAATAIAEFFNNLDSANFLEGKDAFLTFPPNLLMQNIPRIFDEKKLVIQLEDNVLVHPVANMIIQRYKKQGYRLALTNFEFNNRYLSMMPLIDILKIDFANRSGDDIRNQLSICKKFGIQSAAFNVNTPEARESALSLGCDYFQGLDIADMVKTKTHRMDHLQSNFFRLMVAITKDEPDLDEISSIISVDVTLAFSLMKMVNSSYFALPNKVKDIKQALTILGLGQLKQWIYLLSFNADGGIQDELIKTSFLRAIFCQDLAELAPGFPLSWSDAYLLGMFSTLGALLEVPIEDALAELPITQAIKDGLAQGEGAAGDLIHLCMCYEHGEWSRMAKYAERLEIPVTAIAQKYFEAVGLVNDTWDELTKPFEDDGQTAQKLADSASREDGPTNAARRAVTRKLGPTKK